MHMRLISSDGAYDVPYEETILRVDDGAVIATVPALEHEYILAMYDTDDIAMGILRSMRVAFLNSSAWTVSKATDEQMRELSKVLTSHSPMVVATDKDKMNVKPSEMNCVFRFPTQEEFEKIIEESRKQQKDQLMKEEPKVPLQ